MQEGRNKIRYTSPGSSGNGIWGHLRRSWGHMFAAAASLRLLTACHKSGPCAPSVNIWLDAVQH